MTTATHPAAVRNRLRLTAPLTPLLAGDDRSSAAQHLRSGNHAPQLNEVITALRDATSR